MHRTLRLVMLIVAGLCVPTRCSAWPDDGARILKDIAYGEDAKHQTLDIRLPPPTAAPAPLVIWIHGGGWKAGDKRGPHPLAGLARKGFAIAAINYRLSTVAAFPAQLDDCRAAIRFLRGKAAEYQIDPERIGIWGGSAGGHLAALLAVTAHDARDGVPVQAVCDWCGPADLVNAVPDAPTESPINIGELLWQLVLGPDADDKRRRESLDLPARIRLLKAASPIEFVSGQEPPLLIAHGDADTTVPIAQSRRFVAALREAGTDVTFTEVRGAGHRLTEEPACVSEAEEFFIRVLRPDGK